MPQPLYVFNGDFVDRGDYSCEVLILILLLKLCWPEHVLLNRGNHAHVLNQCFKIVNPGYKKRKTLSYGKFSANHESGFRKIPTLGRFRVLFKAVFFGGRNRRFGP